jgi:hypothetical protein
VLFDGKRQKFVIKVIAIVAIVAFAGFGLVAGGLAVSGGCGEAANPAEQAVVDAQESVTSAQAALKSAQGKEAIAEARSDLAKAQGNLASARVGANPNDPEAITDALAAVRTAPGDYNAVQTLVAVASQGNNPSGPRRLHEQEPPGRPGVR